MWEQLVIRHNLTQNTNQDDILIRDTATDQYCITSKAWCMNKRTNRSITYEGYIRGEKQKLDIMSGYSIAYRDGLLPTLIKINKGVLIEDEAKTESLLNLY